MKPRFLITALAVAWAGHSTSARAQAFLSDPRLTEGLGVKVGDFELHPGVAGEFGYDSNYFQAAGGSQEPLFHALRLRITPSISFVTSGQRAEDEGGGAQPAVRFRGQAAASYNALFGTQSYLVDLSKQDNVSGTAGVGMDILPGSAWGGDLGVDFTRFMEASNDAAIGNAWRRDIVRGTAGLVWRPGGGLFKWRLGYGFKGTFFEDDIYDNLNNLQHSLMIDGSWKFLPRTALVYRGNVTWLHYSDAAQKSLGNGLSGDSEIGVNGLISNYFGLLALGGWAASFYEAKTGAQNDRNFDTFVGQAELTWYPAPQQSLPDGGKPVGLSSVSFGYRRSTSASYLAQYFIRDRGYLGATYFFDQRFVLSLNGGLSHITRPTAFQSNGAPIPNSAGGENRVDALAFFEYRPGPMVGINLTFRYDGELTNRLIQGDQLEFDRYQAFLGVRWFL